MKAASVDWCSLIPCLTSISFQYAKVVASTFSFVPDLTKFTYSLTKLDEVTKCVIVPSSFLLPPPT